MRQFILLLCFTITGSVLGQTWTKGSKNQIYAPFVDESTGVCQLSACDALGRSRDELYSVLMQKTGNETQTRNQIQGFLTTMKNDLTKLQGHFEILQRRLLSLEQPEWELADDQLRWSRCSEGPCSCSPETKEVTCWRQDLKTIPGTQKIPTDTRSIDLGMNKLTALNRATFKKMVPLRELDLFDNQLLFLPDGIFFDLENIGHIKLHKNRLESLDPNVFTKNHNLETLDISNNMLKNIASGTFENLRELTLLHLSSNSISALEPGIFRYLERLEDLDLSRNDLTEITRKTFEGLKSLKFLRMTNNQLEHIAPGIFDSLGSLEILQLQNNKIGELELGTFDNLKNLSNLVLTSNAIGEIAPGVFQSVGVLKELHLGGNMIEKLQSKTFYGLNNLEKLFLLSNNIQEVEEDAFEGLIKLTLLSLSNNLLNSIPPDTFSKIPSLQKLQIDSNKFMFLPEGTLDLPNLQYVNLIKNPWHCDCSILYLTKWLSDNQDKISNYFPKCRGPGELGGRPVHGMNFNEVCDGQWASMMSIRARVKGG